MAGSRPYPDLPPGTVDEQLPFDHLVVVMMENHSFDNLLGALSRANHLVDGLTFDAKGEPENSNPGTKGTPPVVRAFALDSTAQGTRVTQTWKATHEQIDGGRMDGFVKTARAVQPMGYYTPDVLPFAYSLAESFTVADRWFSSAPGPTFPNRRFLLAGTAWGCTETSSKALLDPPPPHGTIFDLLSEHHISWADYFTDVPGTLLIPSVLLKHPDHHHRLDKFFHDCESGKLPSVSFVDAGIGVLRSLVSVVEGLPGPAKDVLRLLGVDIDNLPTGETEEDPQDMYDGESWAYRIVEAIVGSPKWGRTLLVYTYDEHGGYYDHVPPPAAPRPDDIPPKTRSQPPGAYDMLGPRVPAIVVSPYSRPGQVTNITHDHTSILATIERKWNLPALTNRDAAAADLLDFLDLRKPTQPARSVIKPPLRTAPVAPARPPRKQGRSGDEGPGTFYWIWPSVFTSALFVTTGVVWAHASGYSLPTVLPVAAALFAAFVMAFLAAAVILESTRAFVEAHRWRVPRWITIGRVVPVAVLAGAALGWKIWG